MGQWRGTPCCTPERKAAAASPCALPRIRGEPALTQRLRAMGSTRGASRWQARSPTRGTDAYERPWRPLGSDPAAVAGPVRVDSVVEDDNTAIG